MIRKPDAAKDVNLLRFSGIFFGYYYSLDKGYYCD